VRPESLPIVPGKRASYHDASLPGFLVRVTPNGVRTYYVWLRLPDGQPRLLKIGDIRGVELGKARQAAKDLLEAARNGVDPREEKRRSQTETEQASLQPRSLREMAERLLAEGRTKRGRPLGMATRALYGRSLRKHVYPALGTVSPTAVRRAEVRSLIEHIRPSTPCRPIERSRPFAVSSTGPSRTRSSCRPPPVSA
jgi:Arm DNA-binding domain